MKKILFIVAMFFAISVQAQVANVDAYRIRARNFFIFQQDTIFNPTRISAAQFKIKDLADPTDPQDAVNLRTLQNFAPDSTGSIHITDTLYIFSDTIIYITSGDSLVTKEYVDSLITTLAGGHDPVTLNPSAILGGLTLAGQELSFQAAGTASNGYLTASNFNIFNNKLSTVATDNTLTGTGVLASPLKVDTTRIATKYYVDTSDDWGSQVVQTDATLTGTGILASPLKVDTTLLATKYYSDLTYVAIGDSLTKYVTITQLGDSLGLLAGGHDPVTIGTANGLSLATQELSLARSNAATTGALHMDDWTDFDAKMDSVNKLSPITGFGTTVNPLGIDTTTYIATKFDISSIVGGIITLSGDVTGTGTGTITTALANQSVSGQTLANPAAASLVLYSNGSALRSTRLDSLGKTSGLFSAGYIRGYPISSTAPTSGQVLAFDGTQWLPGSGASNWTVAGANIWRSSNVAVGGTGYITAAALSVDKSAFGSSGTAMIIRGASTVTTGLQINNGSSSSATALLRMGAAGVSSYFEFLSNGRAKFTQYGGSTMDGAVTKLLGVDSNGFIYATSTTGGGGTGGGDVYSNTGTYVDNQIPRFHGTSGDTIQTSPSPVTIGDTGILTASGSPTDFIGKFYNTSVIGYGLDVTGGSSSGQEILRLRTSGLTTRFQFKSDGSMHLNTYGGTTHAPTIGEAYKYLVVNTSGYVKEVTLSAGAGDMTKAVYDPDDNGIFAPAQGGTGNQFFQVGGLSSSIKTFTFPNASATVLTTNAAVTPTQGGTGIATYTAGDMLYAPSANTLTKLTIGTNGQILASDGTKPVWTSSTSAGGWTDNGTTINLTTATDDVGIGANANTSYKVYIDSNAGQSGTYSMSDLTSGYAGHFINTGTSGNSYGIYSQTASSTGYAGYFDGRLRTTSALAGANLYLGSSSTWWGFNPITNGVEIGSASSIGGSLTGKFRIYNDSIRSLVPLNITGAVTGTSTFTGTNFILSSDKRLKAKIRPLSDLRWVDNVKFYNFHFKGDLSERKRYGVIAQDIEKIAPEFVYENEKGVLSVAYTDLIVAKVARQDQQIEKLEREVQELKKMVETLIKRK